MTQHLSRDPSLRTRGAYCLFCHLNDLPHAYQTNPILFRWCNRDNRDNAGRKWLYYSNHLLKDQFTIIRGSEYEDAA